MASATLEIDLDAVIANWRALDRMSGPGVDTGAVVKADAYGLGAGPVALALARAGARRFFVAQAEEGAALRKTLGPGPEISVFSGHMAGDAAMMAQAELTPMLNSVEQLTRHFEALPGHSFGVQLDTGMNRLGMESAEWEAVAGIVLAAGPSLLMSHLACSDDPSDPMNPEQLHEFIRLTEDTGVPRSLSATGGILLGPDYHFEVTRPGIGLHGCAPYQAGQQAVRLSLPVVQWRDVAAGERVGYANGFVADQPTRIATVAAGYADGLPRTLSGRATLWDGDTPCPLVGRVSMDLITVDVSHLPEVPEALDILGPMQGADDLAAVGGTIGYEILTGLGARYARRYYGGQP
ncbi:alanine racemase [Frigidibacter albus]|uniref:Alanine racemase n=1 Tax=Frigidibacter albus TaxID=1465486 RepID=A0A6L8VK52_9RHOB|nr:alanine racemase [Frigidibacter albus]MZQ90086.1 alanine racemase [Frigidibacter albus]NBE31994.1 alanine racemase [Frigidibacter albus]GGH57466.1 alanine racemase [Frigidibacter albus]